MQYNYYRSYLQIMMKFNLYSMILSTKQKQNNIEIPLFKTFILINVYLECFNAKIYLQQFYVYKYFFIYQLFSNCQQNIIYQFKQHQNNLKSQQDNTYSNIITKVLEIIDLNIEEILQQIEIHFNLIFDILKYPFVPDVQWAHAFKILQLIQKRSQILITKSLNGNYQFLYHFLPYLYNNVRIFEFLEIQLIKIILKIQNIYLTIKLKKIKNDGYNSVAQLLLIYFDNQFHQQQLEFLQIGIQQYYKFDICSAINFTFLIHDIMIRIQTTELMQYLLSSQVMIIANDIIQKETLHFIVRKNAAHIISLISNYYSQDLQNLYLDEPCNQSITEEFRKTEFFRDFNITSIKNILENTLSRNSKVSLLDVKLIEIIDNVVRISDIELWLRVDQSNVMEIIINLVKKYNYSDILIQYFYNMIAFILDRALNDFHPFWCLQLLTKYKLLTQYNKILYNLILYAFEQQLQIKLIRDSDFLPYYNELKILESTLKKSQVWKAIKEQIEKYEDKHKFKLGEDRETPTLDLPLIISAIQEDQYDEIVEPVHNIFIDCHHIQLPQKCLNNNSDSDDEDQVIGTFSGQDIDQNINVFEQMDIQDREHIDDNIKGRKIRNLSNSLNTETSHLKQEFHLRCLRSDHDQMSKLSSSTSTNLKKLNKSFEQFTIEIFENRKVLKNNCIMKVDEIDFNSNQKKN